jgi:uncharacterized protein
MKQVAALPYRIDDAGQIEVMLITSRGRQHWIPPKGNPIKGLEPHEAAAQEAFEEAGLIGRVSSEPIGVYESTKSSPDGSVSPLDVTLYPMAVTDRGEDWPERGQRSALWFELDGASRVVRDPGLARLIQHFRPFAGRPLAAA